MPEPEPVANTDEKSESDEKDNYYEKYLRALADYQNYQKRMKIEAERVKEETTRKLLLDLLPIWDNLELFLYYNNETISHNMAAKFFEFLNNNGINLIEIHENDKFDSNIHEAITFEEKDEVKELVVAEVLRNGFILNNKVLRPAQVKVFKAKI